MIKKFLNYLQYEKRSSTNTLGAYKKDLEQFEEYCFTVEAQSTSEDQSFDISQAKFELVRGWVVSLIDQKLSPRSVNRKIASLNAYYRYLLERNIIQEMPTKKLKSLKVSKKLPHFVKEQEIPQLFSIDNFSTSKYPERDRLVIELFYGTGIRLSELINIKVGDISLTGKHLKVLGKRDKERLIPIHFDLVLLLEQYLEKHVKDEGDYLITTPRGKQAYPSMIQKIVRNYLTKASSAEKKSPHILRHSFATHLLNNGAELNAIKDLLGHANLSATQIYTHNSIGRLKKIFNKTHPKS